MSAIFVVLTATALIAWIGAHATLLVQLAMRRPRWRVLVALVVPPLAPYLALQDGRRRSVYAWGGALVLYAVGVIVLSR